MENIVFFDIDTQFDFIDPAGRLYMRGAEEIMPNVRALLEFATRHRLATISTMDAHLVNDPEFSQFPPHCVAGSPGQRRLLPDLPALPRTTIPSEGIPPDGPITVENGRHYVVQKRWLDVFVNPWLQAIAALPDFRQRQPVVFGVATDYCVWYAVHGLCEAGFRPLLVTDAIRAVDESKASEWISKMVAEGASLITTYELLSEVDAPAPAATARESH